MDLWDLGILIANRAYQAGRHGNFRLGVLFGVLTVKGSRVEAQGIKGFRIGVQAFRILGFRSWIWGVLGCIFLVA